MSGWVAAHILSLPAWVALLVVFALPALESSAFVGFVFPGEIALILGGVLAYQGRVALTAVIVAGVLGAVIGDSVGYLVGRRYGRGVLDGTLGRFVRKDHFDRAETYLAERGGKAVFFGRFTAALRVMIPGLAGMSRMHYRTFAAYNIAGGVIWATMSVLFGYLGGSSWKHVEHVASRIGLGALAVVVLVVLATFLLRRARSGRLLERLAGSRRVVAVRERFPRTSAWTVHRFDPSRPTGLPLTVAVAVAAGAAWTFLGITQDVVTHEELAQLDPRVHAWVLTHRTGFLDTFFRLVTHLGSNAVVVPLLAVAAVVFGRRQRSWRPVLSIVGVYVVTEVLHALVVILVHRPRPPAADWLAPASGWGYPSGHASQAVAAWGMIALLASWHAGPRARVLWWSLAAVVVTAVGASRVYLGVHWLTDVLGGATMIAAVLGLWAVVQLTVLTPHDRPSSAPADDRVRRPVT